MQEYTKMNEKRKREIEILANKVLDKYDITENPPYYFERIFKGENIEVNSFDKWDNELCGKLTYINGKPIIWYNAKHTQEMINFTLAHELGHYFLKHLSNAKPEYICIERDLQRMNDAENPAEVEANHFAACLLMPLFLLKPQFEKILELLQRSTDYIYVNKESYNLNDYFYCINRLKFHFRVSQTAIRFRLINLGWMKFNIKFDTKTDSGISLNDYLKKEEQRREFND